MIRICCYVLLTILFFFHFSETVFAQADQAKKDTLPYGWTVGAGLGFDFAQLLQINPRQGAGQNRLGFGVAVNSFARYRQKRLAVDNVQAWQFGIQRLGSGIVAQGLSRSVPFQKSIDEFRFNTKLGYRTAKKSKWFYATDLEFASQLLRTFQGNDQLPGNFLSDVTGEARLQSQFLNPATLNVSVGIDFKPNELISIYYSPLGGKFIFVPDDAIAALGVHGNPVEGEPDPDTGRYPVFENTFRALGQSLRVDSKGKFWSEKATFTSSLLLFSNYLEKPENIDVNWNSELGLALVDNLQIALNVNVFYDDDVRVQITDWSQPNGVAGLGKRVSITQQLLVKYNMTL